MKKKKKYYQLIIIPFLIVIISLMASLFIFARQDRQTIVNQQVDVVQNIIESNFKPTPTPKAEIVVPSSKTLTNGGYHVFQSFNNCGPAALSMTLSYYDISVSQAELGRQLRPYQNAQGDNDDKSVTLAEVATKAEEYGLKAYRRPNGTPEILEQLIAQDLPVIVRTWLKVDDDIGHYRVVKGYDKNTRQFLQDDSLQGKDLWYSYEEFDQIWQKFNYEYVVLAPPEKVAIVEQILAEDLDEKKAWTKAAQRVQVEKNAMPSDIDAGFNLSVALYNSGDYQASVKAFEEVEARLPARTLWYQIEPILAYMELEQYDRVLQITEKILNNNNRAFSELYIIRGDMYKDRGDLAAARREYELAVRYNENMQLAKDKLNAL